MPLAVRRGGRAIERYHIEAARRCRQRRVRLQKQLRGALQTFAFGRADRRRAAPEVAIATMAHLDEYQRVGIAHYQIDLAKARVEIARDQTQPGLLEMLQGVLFEFRAGRARVHGNGDTGGGVPASGDPVSRPAATGRATPLSKRAHTGVRCTWP